MSELQDRFDIIALASSYSAAAGRLCADDMQPLLIDDAILAGAAEFAGMGAIDIVGAAAIRDFFQAAFDTMRFVHQLPQVADIKLDGDRATATTLLMEMAMFGDGVLRFLVAQYDDDLVRTSDGWRYARRALVVKYFGPAQSAAPN